MDGPPSQRPRVDEETEPNILDKNVDYAAAIDFLVQINNYAEQL